MSSRRVGKEPWEISYRIVIGMNASLPVKRHAVLYATGEYDIYYTYLYCVVFIIYLIFKIKIKIKLKFYFCLWQKKSTDFLQLFSFCTDDNSSHINNKFSPSFYFKIFLYFIVLFLIITLKRIVFLFFHINF